MKFSFKSIFSLFWLGCKILIIGLTLKILLTLVFFLMIIWVMQNGSSYYLEKGVSLTADTDVNGNGIRDDIDGYLIRKYGKDEGQLAAVRQFARVMQASLSVPKGNREAARAVALKSARAISCLFAKFEDPGTSSHMVSKDIVAMTANTKLRMKAYRAYNRAIDGMVFTLPEGNLCE